MTLRLSAFVGVASFFLALAFAGSLPASAEEQKCPENDSGLSLPNGFCATSSPTRSAMRGSLR